jgi:RhoGAP domain
MLKEKAEKIKIALDVILKVENKGLQQSEIFVQQATKTAEHIIGDKDIEQFRNEFKREEFAVSTPIYYHNYYAGESKDLLFGISLLEYAHAHRRTVPLLVIKCVEAVERLGGLKREGIYRISGRQSNIEKLRQAFEKDEEATVFNESTYDVFTIANVMKQFLRELDYPLFPLSMDDRIYHSSKGEPQCLHACHSRTAYLFHIFRYQGYSSPHL